MYIHEINTQYEKADIANSEKTITVYYTKTLNDIKKR